MIMNGKFKTMEHPSIGKFCFEDGYQFMCSDWGSRGVKIEIMHPYEGTRAVILPPEKVLECARWLMCNIKTLGFNARSKK
jgi:hypothetical protein